MKTLFKSFLAFFKKAYAKLKGKEKPYIVRKQLIQLNVPNKNGHIYLLENIDLDKLNNRDGMPLYGECDHPNVFDTSLARVSHICSDISVENGYVCGDIRTLNTYWGKQLKTLLKTFGKNSLVFRPRASGTVDDNGVIQNLKIHTFDAITKDQDLFTPEDMKNKSLRNNDN